MKQLASLLAFAALLATGCAADSPCDQASAHIEDCTGSAPDQFACDDQTADLVLSLSCDELADDAKIEGKSDLLGNPRGAECTLNVQCGSELVCRPLVDELGLLSVGDKTCQAIGTFGDLCDSNSDCNPALLCVGDDLLGGDAGRCRKPIK